MEPKVITWDVSAEAPVAPETWVQERTSVVRVCGGAPDVVVEWGTHRYRHSQDGRLWSHLVDRLRP